MGRVHHSMAALNRTGRKHLWVGLHETVAGGPRRQCVRAFGGIFDWSRPNVGWCRAVEISQGPGESRHCRNGRPYPPAGLGFRLKFRRNTPPSKRLWFSPRRRPRGRPGMCEDLEAGAKTWKLVRKPARRMRFALGNRLIACSRWRYAMEKREASSVRWIRPTCRCSAKSPRSARTGFFDFTEHSGSTGGSSD